MSQQGNRAAAYGIFPVEARLEEVVMSLNSAGFESVDICVFLSPAHPFADGVRTMKAASASLAHEAGFADTVSWLCAFGGVVIPGIGLFLGSREYFHALTRCECWPEGEGREALGNLGIPEETAARYEARVHRDCSLVFVNCNGLARSEWAREVMRRLRAEEVSLLGEMDRTERKSEETLPT